MCVCVQFCSIIASYCAGTIIRNPSLQHTYMYIYMHIWWYARTIQTWPGKNFLIFECTSRAELFLACRWLRCATQLLPRARWMHVCTCRGLYIHISCTCACEESEGVVECPLIWRPTAELSQLSGGRFPDAFLRPPRGKTSPFPLCTNSLITLKEACWICF